MSPLTSKILIVAFVCHHVASLPVQSDLISSIVKVQKKHAGGKTLDSSENSVRVAEEETTEVPAEIPPAVQHQRQHKMLGFYGFVPAFAPIPAYYPTLPFPSTDLYGDYSNYGGYPTPSYAPNSIDGNNSGEEDEDEAMSRANQKKRPSTHFKNSPIYYIRLPPTPYMFVPGLGYISQPPTIQPMAPVLPPPVSPFYNLPINFVSNGKPTGVYQWPPQSQYPFGAPQRPPQRPSYRPYPRPPLSPPPPSNQNSFIQQQQMQQHQQQQQQDSKITNLKGSYLFNGRPEEIYLLPQNPYTASYYPDPYGYQNAYQPGYSGYY